MGLGFLIPLSKNLLGVASGILRSLFFIINSFQLFNYYEFGISSKAMGSVIEVLADWY